MPELKTLSASSVDCVSFKKKYAFTDKRAKQLTSAREKAAKVKRAKTHCVNGHEYTPENTKWKNNGTRRNCRICYNDSRFYARLNKKLQKIRMAS